MSNLNNIFDYLSESDTYWEQQPLKIIPESGEIKTIITSPKPLKVILPHGFEFKTLNRKHYREIYKLLQEHYTETVDEDNLSTRFVYKPTRDFIYWYIRNIPEGFIVGLSYRDKLVGVIIASLFDMIFHNICWKTPYVTFLCVQHKLREMGLGKLLIDEIQQRLITAEIPFAYFTSELDIPHAFATSETHSIDIRKTTLIKLGLWNDHEIPEDAKRNPLHLLTATDIPSARIGLNKSLEKYSIKPYFTEQSAFYLLLPKDGVVHTFVKRSETNEITDLITVYQETLWDVKEKRSISTVKVGFLFHETLDIDSLFVYLIYKLVPLGIDHIVYRLTLDTNELHLQTVKLPIATNHFIFNLQMIKTDVEKVHGLPWGCL